MHRSVPSTTRSRHSRRSSLPDARSPVTRGFTRQSPPDPLPLRARLRHRLPRSDVLRADAWSHWSGGATDPRPMQVVASVNRWLRRDAAFEEIWGTWELSEQLQREVRTWYEQQPGAVLARAITTAVDAVHASATTARNLAEPEAGHDPHDPAPFPQKNTLPANEGLLHDAIEPVRLAVAAGSWWHTHSEPSAKDRDHDAYAKQIVGFLLRQHLSAPDVVQGLRDRLR